MKITVLSALLAIFICCKTSSNSGPSSEVKESRQQEQVTCNSGEFVIERQNGGFVMVIHNENKVDFYKNEGWIKDSDIIDGAFRRDAERKIFNSYYRYYGTKKEGQDTFFEFRWNESTYPPEYASLESWQIMANGSMKPMDIWDFPKSSCTFSDLETDFDLPPPPPPAPTKEVDAKNCEFFVNALGTESRHYTGGGYDEEILVAYVSVNAADLVAKQGGKITQVGMRANGKDDVVVNREMEPAYYVLRKSLWIAGYKNEQYDLKQLAFFIDVQRKNGEIERLWLKDTWHDFNWPEIFDNYPKTEIYHYPSGEKYVEEPSPIFNQRKACKK